MNPPVLLFAGRVRTLPGDSRSSGIFKSAVAGRVGIGPQGLDGDEQADRRVHGGPDKALHFFAGEHYAQLAAHFPDAGPLLTPGSIGENISASGLTEDAICIGDVFALGSARVQVSQPRQPCWKIDARYGVAGLTEFIAGRGCSGGYLRVLESGAAASGDRLTLLDRPPGAPTLAAFWQAWLEHRPEPGRLRELATALGLSGNWQRKLAERIAWLQRQG